jgi:hypothetical protein
VLSGGGQEKGLMVFGMVGSLCMYQNVLGRAGGTSVFCILQKMLPITSATRLIGLASISSP